MTQEEKAKAYDKAIKKIKYVMEHGVSPTLNKEDLQDIFSELKKSEEERIREAQLDYWRSVGGISWHGVPVQEVIVWLEKQGKKKENSNHYEGWINIYKHEYGYTLSREMCNTCEEARKYWNKNTVATIKIEWEEQQ